MIKTFLYFELLFSFQVVIPADLFNNSMQYGSSIHVSGDVVETKMHKDKYELKCKQIHYVGETDPEEFPFNNRTTHEAGYVRSFPHLNMRTANIASVMRVRNSLEMEIHNYFQVGNLFFSRKTVLSILKMCA